jgi:hypothetical protein
MLIALIVVLIILYVLLAPSFEGERPKELEDPNWHRWTKSCGHCHSCKNCGRRDTNYCVICVSGEQHFVVNRCYWVAEKHE